MPSIWFGFLTAWNPQLLRYHFSDLEEFLLTGMSCSYTFYFFSDTIICLNQYCWGDRALCLPWHQIESTRSQQRGSFTFPLSLTFLFLTNLYSHHSHLLKPLHPLHSPLSVLPSSFSIFLPHQSLTFSSWHSTHSLRPSIRPLVDCPTRWSLWYGYLDFYFDTQMTWEI